jgi:hypothetical protein
MGVLDNEDPRQMPAQLLEDVDEFAQRLLGPAARGLDLLLQHFPAIEDRRHLREQPRRDAANEIDEQRSHRPGGQLFRRRQQRPVGLARPVMRHALATDHPQVPAPVEAPGKGVDERGLADAGLAGDEQNLPLAAPGARQAAVHNLQLRLAADAERCSRGERSRRAAIPFMTGPGDQFDVADQAIAALPDGLDVARGRRRVAEERAQLPHALLRPVLAAMALAPDHPAQFVAADHVAAALEQMAQHRRRPGPYRHAPGTLPQRAARHVEAEPLRSGPPSPTIVRGLHRRAIPDAFADYTEIAPLRRKTVGYDNT